MFGFSTFSQDSFSSSGDTSISVVVSVTTVACTGQIGTASAGQFVTVLPTGVQAQGQIGNLGQFALGVQGNTSIGPYSIAVEGNVVIVLETPVTGTTQLGNETFSLDCVLTMTGVQANTSLGSVDFKIDTIATPRESENFTITVKSTGSGNKYFVNGIQQQMPTALHKGFTYKFDQSDSSNTGHPLRFSTTQDGSNYTDGVTVVGTPGQSGAYTQIVVADNAPSTLYVKCNIHSGMGFAVTVGVNVNLLMTSSEGTVSLSMGVTVFPSGVSTLTQIGTVLVKEGSTVFPTGVTCTGEIGKLVLWQEVDTSQTPNWTRIAA